MTRHILSEDETPFTHGYGITASPGEIGPEFVAPSILLPGAAKPPGKPPMVILTVAGVAMVALWWFTSRR